MLLLLLPPSESKRAGGGPATRVALSRLAFPSLTAARKQALGALAELSRDDDVARRALGLGVTQDAELVRNRAVRRSPTMAALDRYDGVLFDALGPATLPAAAREFAAGRIAIASALFGLVGADDPIPAYRLSHDSRLPEVRLAALWREPISRVLGSHDGLIVDLRSSGYAALGPVPDSAEALVVSVVSAGSGGRRRALGHFNKAAKGEFVRRLLLAGVDHPDADSLLGWCAAEEVRLERTGPAAADLVVE